jgi:hypothetical protein
MKSWDGQVDTADPLPVAIVASMARVELIAVRSSQMFPIPPKLSGDYGFTSAGKPALPQLRRQGEEKTAHSHLPRLPKHHEFRAGKAIPCQ